MVCVASVLYFLALRGTSSPAKRKKANEGLVAPPPASRRSFVTKTATNLLIGAAAFGSSTLPSAAVDQNAGTVRVTLKSPQDRLGWELYEVDIGSPPRSVVAIRGSTGSAFTTTTNQKLQTGMILEDFGSLDKLKTRLQTGPYPVELVFSNLGAGGDAISDTGAPLVTAQDALQLARSNDAGQTANKSGMNGFRVDITDKPTCKIQSRRNDVLEIRYVAQFGDSPVVYDSSERRGTGQPYQMVLGSGDMLTGVDLGLYDMCPGERRRITIPPRFGYGSKGNRLFGVPPDQTLTWDVELVRINGVVGEDDERSRDEMEERVPYSSPR